MPFFQGSVANEYRRQEFERFRCGHAFYSVVRPVPNDVCKKYLYSIGFYVYDKAHGKPRTNSYTAINYLPILPLCYVLNNLITCINLLIFGS